MATTKMELKILCCLLLALCITSCLALQRGPQRIVGGSLTTIKQYPFTASLLYSWDLVSYSQACGGTILTTTAVLTAAHCVAGDQTSRWRVRVGSSFANSGGTVHTLRVTNVNSAYSPYTMDNDVAVMRTAAAIVYKANAVAPASIAGPAYALADNQPVWAVGWGTVSSGGQPSEQLRHVQIWSINQATCRSRYAELGYSVTDNMLCSGWLDVGTRDQCQGDSGGPLIHNNVIVGICSWGFQCADARYPGVNTRVSRYTYWIQSAAA